MSIFLALLAIIVAAGCKTDISGRSGEKTIMVPADYPDLGTAVKKASPGATILLSPGTYQENSIDIDKAITITSEWKLNGDESKIDQTIIDAQDQILFNISAPGGEISGLKIIKGDHTLNITANTTIKYNHFDDNLDALSFESGSGGYAGFNVITNDRDDGMDMDIGSQKTNIGSDIVVENNIISNSNDDGIEIRLYTAPDQNIRYNIHGNKITGSNNAGIQLISYDVYTGKIFQIHHNIFTGCKTALGCMEGSNTKEDLTGASKMDELVWFYNNTCSGNQMGATGGNKVIAFNNVIMNNSLGGFKRFGQFSVVKNNLFFNNGQPDLIELNSTIQNEANIFSKDPLLDQNTFTPMSGSPCTDKGLMGITLDGSTKMDVLPAEISGSGSDLGAVEFK